MKSPFVNSLKTTPLYMTFLALLLHRYSKYFKNRFSEVVASKFTVGPHNLSSSVLFGKGDARANAAVWSLIIY
jgi:hypothetical protein